MAATKAGAPSHTLYCSNLNDKLPKDDLKQELYMLFSTYGPVLDIVALKTTKMRGQAHVTLQNSNASTQAMRALQGLHFHGRDMKISYASSKSHTLAKLDGTFKQPEMTAATSATNPQPTSLQQSIFAGPPGGAGAATAGPPSQPPPGLEPSVASASADTSASQGVKRARDESDDEQGAEMEMDDAAMEESDED